MAPRALPPQAVLRQLLDYNPDTGSLTWRKRGEELFTATPARTALHLMRRWNACYAGKEAFTASSTFGHREGKIFGQSYMAHRVIWKMITGEDPVGIDHINGNPSDNRIANLRDCNQADNARNAALRRDNQTGVCGVHRRGNSWVAQIAEGDTTKHITQSLCFGVAIKARKAAERRLGYHPNHGRAA